MNLVRSNLLSGHLGCFGHFPLAGLAVLELASCSSPEFNRQTLADGEIALPAETKAIVLTVARPSSEFSLQLPDSKQAAANSSAAAYAKGMASDPYAAFLFPVGYLMGGVIGGSLGVSERELASATPPIVAVSKELNFADRLAHPLSEHVNAGHPGWLHLGEDNIAVEPRQGEGKLMRVENGRLMWCKPTPPAHPLLGTGCDIVLRLRVTYQGFQARSNPHVRSTDDAEQINPPLALVFNVDLTAVRVRDWANLGGVTVSYQSKPLKFIDWSADGARPLRLEIEKGIQEILTELKQRVVSRPKGDFT